MLREELVCTCVYWYWIAVATESLSRKLLTVLLANAVTNVKLAKVAVVMHCNLRSPNFSPVVLDFNCRAHNAPVYKFNISTRHVSAIADRWAFVAFLARFILHLCVNCYFRALGQILTPPQFSIWYGHFGDQWTCTMWPWPLTLNICSCDKTLKDEQ